VHRISCRSSTDPFVAFGFGFSQGPSDSARSSAYLLTYRDLFLHANRHLCGQSVVIANADMFFDETLRRLEEYDLSGKLLCLSRWDVQKDGTTCFFEHPCSQDAWIFRAPIIESFRSARV
jgi:hypothetical protein